MFGFDWFASRAGIVLTRKCKHPKHFPWNLITRQHNESQPKEKRGDKNWRQWQCGHISISIVGLSVDEQVDRRSITSTVYGRFGSFTSTSRWYKKTDETVRMN